MGGHEKLNLLFYNVVGNCAYHHNHKHKDVSKEDSLNVSLLPSSICYYCPNFSVIKYM